MGDDLASRLGECQVGLICLTPENLSAPWILFEAGALAKTVDNTFVCPYLLDLRPADIQGPLAQFQLTRAEKEDTCKLLHTLNRAVQKVANKQALSETQLNVTFEKWWEDLDRMLRAIPPVQPQGPPQRSDREILEEILVDVRMLMRIHQTSLWSSSMAEIEKEIEKKLSERLLNNPDLEKAELSKFAENYIRQIFPSAWKTKTD